jgi:hypothetical protein
MKTAGGDRPPRAGLPGPGSDDAGVFVLAGRARVGVSVARRGPQPVRRFYLCDGVRDGRGASARFGSRVTRLLAAHCATPFRRAPFPFAFAWRSRATFENHVAERCRGHAMCPQSACRWFREQGCALRLCLEVVPVTQVVVVSCGPKEVQPKCRRSAARKRGLARARDLGGKAQAADRCEGRMRLACRAGVQRRPERRVSRTATDDAPMRFAMSHCCFPDRFPTFPVAASRSMNEPWNCATVGDHHGGASVEAR